jgi:hypothetical protein
MFKFGGGFYGQNLDYEEYAVTTVSASNLMHRLKFSSVQLKTLYFGLQNIEIGLKIFEFSSGLFGFKSGVVWRAVKVAHFDRLALLTQIDSYPRSTRTKCCPNN